LFIMGVDPGTAITGYGLVRYNGSRFSLVECGCIRTSPDSPMCERLQTLYRGLSDIMRRCKRSSLPWKSCFLIKTRGPHWLWACQGSGHAGGFIIRHACV
jgi:crossover junction endodeoxyribonuclease RuvC